MTDHRYFAASNTGFGFLSRFPEIFDPEKFDTVYIIKGGPGTGKSTFMKKLGEEAERRGYAPEYYFCSSDIHSLDGLIIRERGVCVLDGTAPHVTEAKFPGAVETILNFGAAFDTAALRENGDKIKALAAENSEMYVRAYASLRAAREITEERLRVCRSFYLSDKAESFIGRFLSGAEKGEVKTVGLGTVCGEGEVRLPTLENIAESRYAVTEFYGVEQLLMRDIERFARRRGLAARVGPGCVCPDIPEEIYFEKSGVHILGEAGDDGAKPINARRFANVFAVRAERGYLRLTKKLAENAVMCAASSMKKAGEIHARLEEIYTAHTNFSVIDEIYEKVKDAIFEN